MRFRFGRPPQESVTLYEAEKEREKAWEVRRRRRWTRHRDCDQHDRGSVGDAACVRRLLIYPALQGSGFEDRVDAAK